MHNRRVATRRNLERTSQQLVNKEVDEQSKSLHFDGKALAFALFKPLTRVQATHLQLVDFKKYINPNSIDQEMFMLRVAVKNGKIYIGIPFYNPDANPDACRYTQNQIAKIVKKILRNETYHQFLTANGRREYSIVIYDGSVANTAYAVNKISDELLGTFAANIGMTSFLSLNSDKASKLNLFTMTLNNQLFNMKDNDLKEFFPVLKVYKNIKKYDEFPELRNNEITLFHCLVELENQLRPISEAMSAQNKQFCHRHIDLDADVSSQWDNIIANIIASSSLLEQDEKISSLQSWAKDASVNLNTLLEECLLQHKKCIALEEACDRLDRAFSGISIEDQITLLRGCAFLTGLPDFIRLRDAKNDYLTHINELNKQITCLTLGLEKLQLAKDKVSLQLSANKTSETDSNAENVDVKKTEEPVQDNNFQYVDNINQPSLKVTTKREAEKKIEKEERRDELKANRGYHLYSFAVDPGFNPTANDNKPEKNNENTINLVIKIKDKNSDNERQVNVTAIRLGKTQSLYMVCEDVIYQRETDECHAFLAVCQRNKVLPKDSKGVNGLKEWGDSGSYVSKSKKHGGSHLVLHPCVIENDPEKTVYLPAEIIGHDYYEAQYQNTAQIQANCAREMNGITVSCQVELNLHASRSVS